MNDWLAFKLFDFSFNRHQSGQNWTELGFYYKISDAGKCKEIARLEPDEKKSSIYLLTLVVLLNWTKDE